MITKVFAGMMAAASMRLRVHNHVAIQRLLGVVVLLALQALLLTVVNAQSSIVMVAPPPALLEAAQRTLHPWDISVSAIEAEDASPSESMPGARDRAKQLCHQHGARAIVWLTSNRDGEALWVFDMQTDRVVVRKLNVKLPLQDSEAAAVALSIKTLLMHTPIAPPAERFGAEVVDSKPAASRPASMRASSTLWSATSGFGVRRGINHDGHTEMRLALGIYRNFQHLRVGAQLSSGTGYSLENPNFRGHIADWSLAAETLLTKPWQGFHWFGGASLGLHRTHLSGVLTTGDASVSVIRYNPSIGARVGLEKAMGATRIGLGSQLRYFTRSQRYLAAGTTVLHVPTFDIETGIYLSLSL